MLFSNLLNYPSWLIGSLLGDKHVTKYGQLQISHSIKQKEYFFLKYHLLQEISALSSYMSSHVTKYSRLDKRTNKVYQRYYVSSLSHFKELRLYFYKDNIKYIPHDIHILFNPEALAFWFMDDGGRNSSKGKGMVIDISCFSLQDQLLLQHMMLHKFNCQVSFHRKNEKNTKLYIKSESAQHFCNLIRPYIIPEMAYKLTC